VPSRIYTSEATRRALTPTGGFLKGYAFSLNPYIGCAFGAAGGCPFCYVRALPVSHARAGDWGSWVIAKSNLCERLEIELKTLERSGKLADTTIFMSSATDPYQGIERWERLTRGALEIIVRHPIRRLLLQTRSPIIERDIDVVRELGSRVIVSITIETDDDGVRRAITPTSPSIERRIRTAQSIRDNGIPIQVAIAPMLPNDPQRFAAIVDRCADRVVVDTYFAGDGSCGRRSRALGIGGLYARLGYADWFRPGAEAPLLDAMRAKLGDRRVLFSRDGFCAV